MLPRLQCSDIIKCLVNGRLKKRWMAGVKYDMADKNVKCVIGVNGRRHSLTLYTMVRVGK